MLSLTEKNDKKASDPPNAPYVAFAKSVNYHLAPDVCAKTSGQQKNGLEATVVLF